MTLKKILPVTTLIFVFAASGTLALAQPAGGRPEGQAPTREAQFSPEDWDALDGLWRGHHQKTDPLRDQLWAKEMEYDALVANPNTKPGEVKAVINEMGRLRAQLRGERENFRGQMEAKGFDQGWPGHGYHRGGYHRGYAYADDGAYGYCPGYGYGYGSGKGRARGYDYGHGRGYGPGRGYGYGPGRGYGRHHGGGHHWR